jgi:hypothetical protein
VNTFFLMFLGCFTGFFVCTRVGTAITMFVRERKAAQTAGQKSLWAVYAAVVFHSGIWLLCGALVLLGWFIFYKNTPVW